MRGAAATSPMAGAYISSALELHGLARLAKRVTSKSMWLIKASLECVIANRGHGVEGAIGLVLLVWQSVS